MGKVDRHVQCLNHAFVIGQFSTIIIGDGFYSIFIIRQTLDDFVSNQIFAFVARMPLAVGNDFFSHSD